MGIKLKITAFLLLSVISLPLAAQRRVSADVELKTVADGKSSTVTKSVYCTNNGRLVTFFKSPVNYCMITNFKGETQVYKPDSNEVMSTTDPEMSSVTELVSLFMSGRIDDLGLGFSGYKLSGASRDGGYLIRKFTPSAPSLPLVEIVSENYLPIYCAYTTADGKVLGKKYLSDYRSFGRFTMPLRITDISYGKDRDSTVTRTIYSSVKVDSDDPAFDFRVPDTAKPVSMDKSFR